MTQPPSPAGPGGSDARRPRRTPATLPTRPWLALIGGGLVLVFVLGWAAGRWSGGDDSPAQTRTATPGTPSSTDGSTAANDTSKNDAPDEQITPDLSGTPDPADAVPAPPTVPAGLLPAAPAAEFSCPAATITVSSTDQLYRALADAKAGDSIHLNDGIYQEGDDEFTASAKGTASQPVYLCGGRGAILQGQGYKANYVLHLENAAYWRLDGFTVRFGQKGVMVDSGTHLALQNLTVADIGDEAVHLRKNSTDNVVRGLTIYNTGNRRDKFGEGVYVGTAQSNWPSITGGQPDHSDRNFVLDNVISRTTSEAIDIKEGTTGGVVAGNSFDGAMLSGADSWVDVKGNDWLIAGNRGRTSPKDGFQTHVIVKGWGNDNRFVLNVADVDGGSGVGYYLHELLNNKVNCDNKAAGATGGLSNFPCVS